MPFGFCKESAWEKEQRGEGGWRKGLSVSAARWGFEGAGYIHIPVQKDSAGGQFAGQFERAQPAAHQRQHAHCSGRRCTHCGGPAGARTARHHIGHLQPCFRQEQKSSHRRSWPRHGVIEEKKNSPRNSKGCFGAPDWTRTSGLPGRSRTLYPTELRTHIYENRPKTGFSYSVVSGQIVVRLLRNQGVRYRKMALLCGFSAASNCLSELSEPNALSKLSYRRTFI